MDIGIAGEFRAVVTKADGTVKTDTGYQKNLILDQGLDFFGKTDDNGLINYYCVVGAGNSIPAPGQTRLDSPVAPIVGGYLEKESYGYVDDGSKLYKMWEERKYRFDNLNDVNISEVGLIGKAYSDTALTTRALIKDVSGTPTTITINDGEVLDIYYRIYKVVDVSDKTYTVNMLDGDGGNTPYNVTIRPIRVGRRGFWMLSRPAAILDNYIGVFSDDLVDITELNTTGGALRGRLSMERYTKGSFKKVLYIDLGLDDANIPIRTVTMSQRRSYQGAFPFYSFQARFGSVEDDSPILKTNMHKLRIPFEVSWGRYEGDL